MKILDKYIEKINSMPIEQFRSEAKDMNLKAEELLRLHPLILVLLNIALALVASFRECSLSEIAPTLLSLFDVSVKASIFIAVGIPIYAAVVHHICSRSIYPRIREDIKENPETITNYKIIFGDPEPTAVITTVFLILIDAAIFSLPTFAAFPYSITFMLACNGAPLLSFIITDTIWQRINRKEINRL